MTSQRAVTDPIERLVVGRDEIALRVTSQATGGALLVADVTLPAGGGPPALHRHDPTEVYRVARGDLTVYVEDEDGELGRLSAGPGAVIHIPAGLAHTVRNESDDEVHAHVVFSPGAIEHFFRAAAELAAAGPPRIEDVLALAEEHGIEMAGPLPSYAEERWRPPTSP